MSKIIEVKNENCDWEDDGFIPVSDYDVFAIYYKNNKWNLYCCGEIKKQEDEDGFFDEIIEQCNVNRSNIKIVRPVSVNFVETSAKELLKKKEQKSKVAAKKKIAALKEKYGV